MLGVRVRVSQIIDFGPTVAVVGTEIVSGLPIVLQIDYRRLAIVQDGWRSAGLSERIKFDADGLGLRLDLDGAEDPDGGIALSQEAA